MRIVSNGDNLHEMLNPVFWKKIRQNIINLSCAEFAQRVVKVKDRYSKKRVKVSCSSWGLGRAAVCDCGTPWTFLLPFFFLL